jgi:hypothetical protein
MWSKESTINIYQILQVHRNIQFFNREGQFFLYYLTFFNISHWSITIKAVNLL